MDLRRDDRRIFWALLLAAIVLRLFAFNPYSAHQPDEIIQYLEQAHRRVFGYGLIPWEFRYFIRSWLIPLMLEPLMRIGEWLDPGGTLYLILPRAMVAVINFTPVISAWYIGRRISRDHAIAGMAMAALWIEYILFSVQLLSESLAISCFMAAVALLHREAKFRAIVMAGALMALAGIFRFQFGPAMAVYGIMIAGRDARMWKGLIAGGLPVLIAGGALDLAMGLWPYEWILNNYLQNIAAGKMKAIGGVSYWYYLLAIPHFWVWATVPILFMAAQRWKQDRALLIAALVNFAVHQLIGHKEYRYLWLSAAIVLLVAAFGTVDWLRKSERPRFSASCREHAGVISAVLWALMSLSLAVLPTYRLDWRSSGNPSRLAAETVRDPAVCGLAVPRGPYWMWGYSLVHQNKPQFQLDAGAPPSRTDPTPVMGGFNAMLVWAGEPAPKGFPERGPCMGGVRDRICVYRRTGGCRIDQKSHALETQQVLYQLDM